MSDRLLRNRTKTGTGVKTKAPAPPTKASQDKAYLAWAAKYRQSLIEAGIVKPEVNHNQPG